MNVLAEKHSAVPFEGLVARFEHEILGHLKNGSVEIVCVFDKVTCCRLYDRWHFGRPVASPIHQYQSSMCSLHPSPTRIEVSISEDCTGQAPAEGRTTKARGFEGSLCGLEQITWRSRLLAPQCKELTTVPF